MLHAEGNLGEAGEDQNAKDAAGVAASLKWSPAVERFDRELRFIVKCPFTQIVQ